MMSYRSGSNDTALDSTGTSHSFVSSEPASSMPGEYSYVATQRRLFFLYTAVTPASDVDPVGKRHFYRFGIRQGPCVTPCGPCLENGRPDFVPCFFRYVSVPPPEHWDQYCTDTAGIHGFSGGLFLCWMGVDRQQFAVGDLFAEFGCPFGVPAGRGFYFDYHWSAYFLLP